MDGTNIVGQPTFREELCNLLNKHGKESASNTPDFILATYIEDCLEAYSRAIVMRRDWNRSTGQFRFPATT